MDIEYKNFAVSLQSLHTMANNPKGILTAEEVTMIERRRNVALEFFGIVIPMMTDPSTARLLVGGKVADVGSEEDYSGTHNFPLLLPDQRNRVDDNICVSLIKDIGEDPMLKIRLFLNETSSMSNSIINDIYNINPDDPWELRNTGAISIYPLQASKPLKPEDFANNPVFQIEMVGRFYSHINHTQQRIRSEQIRIISGGDTSMNTIDSNLGALNTALATLRSQS